MSTVKSFAKHALLFIGVSTAQERLDIARIQLQRLVAVVQDEIGQAEVRVAGAPIRVKDGAYFETQGLGVKVGCGLPLLGAEGCIAA